jgi:glycosyltransferase involved in cell wall biosynthesis
MARPLRPVLVSTSDGLGGADIAAYRLHQALLGIGIDSTMMVRQSITADPTVQVLATDDRFGRSWLREHLTELTLWTQKSVNGVHRSLNLVPSGSAPSILAQQPDLVHLHWVGSDLLSLSEIERLPRPVVWTMHDSWPFCGAEHHPADLADARYRDGYSRATRANGDSRFDLDAFGFRAKQRTWSRHFTLATPSRWMAQNASSSLLMGHLPVTVIPNAIPVADFAPRDRLAARRELGLDPTAPIVAFGAIGAQSDPNKGWDLLTAALAKAVSAMPDLQALVFGGESSGSASAESVGLPIHAVGRVTNAHDLARVYAAADVFVVPSRMESFSQTAAEAQSVGIPVVGFAATGLLDVVDDGVTGALVAPFDPQALADGILRVLSADGPERAAMGSAARERAVRLWSPAVVAGQYAELYAAALEETA